MKTNCINFFLGLFLVFIGLPTSGQQTPSAHMIGRGKVYKDSIVLRWALNTELAWNLAKETGYVVERADMSVKNAPFIKIATLKPWSAEEIGKLYLSTKDRYTGIALATLYGNTALKESEFSMEKAKEMSNMLRMRFAYNLLAADQNAAVANMSALRFTDRNIEPGKSYAYRIYAPIASKSCRTDTAIVYLSSSEIDAVPIIPELRIQQGDTKLELIWKYLRPDFSAFNLERSADGGKKWVKLNEIPYVVIENLEGNDFLVEGRFVDTGLTNYKFYQYRISAITNFGEQVAPGKPAESYPRDLSPPQNPEITKLTQGESKEMKLEWKFSGNKRELKGFKVARADRADGQYFELGEILGVNTTSFKDPNPDAEFGNYYMVYAIDTAGNVSASLPKLGFVKDDLPPSTPELVSATMDTTGKVSILWKPVKANDLMGYRLYTANDSTHEFGLVTGDIITDSFYFDSLTVWTLSKYRFYRIAALDLAYNMSKLSAIIPVRRPDLIPPLPPVLLAVNTGSGGLNIELQGSTSDDVKSQYIEFVSGKESFILPFNAGMGERISVTDTLSLPGKAYELRAYAIDSAGNRSENPSTAFAQRPESKADILKSFTANWDPQSAQVLLNWTLNSRADKVAVYRAESNGKMEWIGDVKTGINTFSDKPGAGKTYTYSIHIMGSNMSVYSPIVEVVVP